jgi:hypothetical protein
MLIFRKDSINVIRTSLAELSTLASPTYLIEMISDQSLISTTCIAADASTYPSRYNEFTITETATPNNLNAEILLEPVGYFTYNIYEQTSTTNLSPNDAGVILLESGKARCLIDGDREATTYTFYDTPTPQVAFWSVFDSEGIVPTPPSTDATYQNSDASFVQVIPKATTYTAPDISFTDSDGTVLSRPSNIDLVCTPSGTGPTIYNRPTPAWGNMTSAATYDEAWQYQNGTYTTGYAQVSGQIQELDNTDLSRLTLKYDNQFANKNRYTDESGGQVFNNLLLDNLHGLMFRRDPVNEEWSTGLTTAATTTFEGYSDWRVVNWTEISTIVNNQVYPMLFTPYFTAWTTGTIPHTCSLRNSSNAQHLRFSVSQLTSLVGNTGVVDLLWVRTM